MRAVFRFVALSFVASVLACSAILGIEDPVVEGLVVLDEASVNGEQEAGKDAAPPYEPPPPCDTAPPGEGIYVSAAFGVDPVVFDGGRSG